MRATQTVDTSLQDGLRTLASLELLPAAQRRIADEAADKLAGLGIYVAVIGEFKRGKTTLINALLGTALLPTGVIPVTTVPALVRFGVRPRAMLRLLDGAEVDISIGTLAEYLTEQQNPGNKKNVREAVIEYPAAILESGIILVDTPGTGSVHLHNTQAAVDFLPRVDVALLVLSVDAPLSESETRLLADVANTAARIAICLNKVDRLTPAETRDAMEFIQPRVAALFGGTHITVFAVSALSGGADPDRGLSKLRSWLANDVAGDSLKVARERGARLTTTLLSLVDATLQLEAAAAAKPAREAALARTAFIAAQDELANAVDEESALLLAACRRATETVIEPSANLIRASLPDELIAGTDDEWASHIATAAATWRREVGDALLAAIRGPVDRHSERIHELATAFMDMAGNAFGVQLPAAFEVERSVDVDAIRVDLAEDPGALAMGVRQLRAHTPGVMGQKWRDRARRERAVEDADRLAGRLRYATVQSVDRTARHWIREGAESARGVSDALAGAVARAEDATQGPDAHVPDISTVRACGPASHRRPPLRPSS